jgi:hypothetical protein
MKRIIFGIIWFIVFWFGTLIIGSIIYGLAGHGSELVNQSMNAANSDEAYDAGNKIGHAAGLEFSQKYGRIIRFSSLLLAVAGALTGVLPGTKPPKKKEDESQPK